MESQENNTRNSTSAIARYVLGLGPILFGLVSITTITLGMYVGSFAYTAIIALLVGIVIPILFKEWQTIYERLEKVG